MQIKILRSTVADGRFVKAGNIEEITARDAMLLIRLGKAEAVDELPAQPTVMTTDNFDGVVEEKPRRGRPRSKHGV